MLEFLTGLVAEFQRVIIDGDRYKFIITGLQNTFIITFGALAIGIILGILVAAIRTSFDKNKEAMLFGVGLDNRDGHKRITKGDNFYLAGGSEETHEQMTETVIKFNEKLARKGKNLHELSREEFTDMMREAQGK